MSDFLGCEFPKSGGIKVKVPHRARREALKRHFAALWNYWRSEKPMEEVTAMDNQFYFYPLSDLELDHIKNVGSHKDGEYDLMNLQLITPQAHAIKTNAKTYEGQRKDYRPPEFVAWLKTLIF